MVLRSSLALFFFINSSQLAERELGYYSTNTTRFIGGRITKSGTDDKLQFAGTCWILIDSIVLWILLGLRFDSIVFWMGQQIPTGPIHSHSVSIQLGS